MTEKELYELVRLTLTYNPTTGLFTHNIRPRSMFTSDRDWKKWNTRYAGKEAGSTKKNHWNGKYYKYIRLLDRDYMFHRIVWLYINGVLPEVIDHINGDPTDNRLCNLRNTTPLGNSRNMRRRKNNVTGIPGVIIHCQNGRYVAQIGVEGKTKHLGITPDFFEACCLRKSAENRYGFGENHGSNCFISSN
uniref:HNH endonuclease n=1 Tax=Klebsiella phage KpTRp1 TaxID=3236632 RepID=A0AB39AJ78_9CAUD